MAVDLVGPITDWWSQYIFGSVQIGAIIFLALFIMIGLKRNWPLDLYVVVLPPVVLLLSLTNLALLPPTLWVVTLIGLGLMIGVGILRFIRH